MVEGGVPAVAVKDPRAPKTDSAKLEGNPYKGLASSATVESEVDSLVRELNPGKSTKELMDEYKGKEEELLANLRKLRDSRREIV